jgi:hypothetical protein
MPPERARKFQEAVLAKAHATECADEGLQSLGAAVQRYHVHWTHVRTKCATHRQPNSFTREQFWQHLETCYRMAYPLEDSLTGSILMFGCVAKERHSHAWGSDLRDEHHHCATYCSAQHYWSKVAKISRETFSVFLNAVTHTGYTEMWKYLREPSAKKPLAELDAEIFLSPFHPRGEDLTKLLEQGARSVACRRGSSTTLSLGNRGPKRARVESVFELVKAQNVQSVADLEVFAHREAVEGRTAVAEFCTRHGHKLQQMIASARRVMDAPALANERNKTLLDKLREAAEHLACVCGDVWIHGACQVLQRNGIHPPVFAAAVLRAFEIGAKRGVNVGLIGSAGCGKSMLVEPLEFIFKAAGKPQKGSSFSLSNTTECDILLWQDYRHDENTVCFTDLLNMLVGETVDIRMPGERNVKVKNTAPLIYTGRTPILSTFQSIEEREGYDEMMAERFTVFSFTKPVPKAERRPDHPHCGKCCATFYLTYGSSRSTTVTPSPVSSSTGPPVAPPTPRPDLVSHLLALQQLHTTGALSLAEFTAAKAQLLSL